jgi:hypothetical protein
MAEQVVASEPINQDGKRNWRFPPSPQHTDPSDDAVPPSSENSPKHALAANRSPSADTRFADPASCEFAVCRCPTKLPLSGAQAIVPVGMAAPEASNKPILIEIRKKRNYLVLGGVTLHF